jgi:tellurite resistance protein
LGFWDSLKQAFGEGYEEERAGAPLDLHLDAMTLAARADREVTDHELTRIATLLRRHLHVFSAKSEESVTQSLRASGQRLDRRGDEQAQFAHTTAALVKAGGVACHEAYALAYAVLLSDEGLNDSERVFAERLAQALGISGDERRQIERALDSAIQPPS